MPDFSFETMVADIKSCVRQADKFTAIRGFLEELVTRPDDLLAASNKLEAPETLLHEDEDVSIWHCRFQPDVIMPPHEHLLPVFIAAYAGEEKSFLYTPGQNGLHHIGDISASAGEVILLEKDAIHAVTAAGDTPSEAIHVYLGPLMTLKRDLYDWESGHSIDFTMEAFEAMKRRP